MPDLKTSPGITLSHLNATQETILTKHETILPDHMFSGITKLEAYVVPDVLRQTGLSLPDQQIFLKEAAQVLGLLRQFNVPATEIRHRLRRVIGDGGIKRTNPQEHISRSAQTRSAFERADVIAKEAGAKVIAVQHVLAALLEIPDTGVRQLLREMRVDIDALRQAAAALPVAAPSLTASLDEYGIDLVAKAREGKIKPVIGRKDEISQILRILASEAKSPVLVGDAGVGKTAIVEGIALRIAQQNIHPDFHNLRIIQINAPDMMAGTKYRGDFEERMKALIAELSQVKDVVVFIDEIHLIVGSSSSGDNPVNMANIFKPALSRGAFKIIGATTYNEYVRYIEKDAALDRRFQPVQIGEPTSAETVGILKGLRDILQAHHGVTINDDAIEAAVRLSVRYIPDRRLPDKAYDILDRACAGERYGRGVSWSVDQPPPVGNVRGGTVVTADSVRREIEELTDDPLREITPERLLTMADELRGRIVGQDYALQKVAQMVQRGYSPLKPPGRPMGVLLFLGPTGVGKTELAKATAEFLFGSEDALFRLDMSEFMEKHTVNRLIGSPPGYVDGDIEGDLTGHLRRKPFSVVLIDEIEKAHPDIQNIFLQLFDDGRLTDGRGRRADGTSTLFILTSNVGASHAIGFSPDATEADQDIVLHMVRAAFRPEFLNRLSDQIIFRPLTADLCVQIVNMHLEKLSERLMEQRIELKVTDVAAHLLAEFGFSEEFGAREVRRVVEQLVEVPASLMMLRREIRTDDMLVVDVKDDAIELRVRPRRTDVKG